MSVYLKLILDKCVSLRKKQIKACIAEASLYIQVSRPHKRLRKFKRVVGMKEINKNLKHRRICYVRVSFTTKRGVL
jgi:hypothetical protein